MRMYVSWDAMKTSAQSHFERTSWWSHAVVLTVFLAALASVIAMNAERLFAASLFKQLAVAFAVLVLLTWPRYIFGELIGEIVRECTRARCPKCQGPAKANLESDTPHYLCQSCGHQEPIDIPSRKHPYDFSGGHDGLGGGGG
jgi:hypothetical protein